MAPVLRFTGVTKRFGLRPVLQGVDLALEPGERLGLLGTNGSGKTTLLKAAAGVLRPTTGTVEVEGTNLHENRGVRRAIGLVSHQPALYDGLTARENLFFFARLYGVPGVEIRGRVQELLERVGLGPRADDWVRTFSRGMKQRLALARALVHRPSLLLLDEPSSHLDPAGREALRSLLGEFGGVLLLASSDPAETALAERTARLAEGRIREA